jgi:hypothetical protein
MKTVVFNPGLGSLSVNVACGFAQTGSYVIFSKKDGESTEIGRGDFIDPDNDRFDLPGGAPEYDGRILECVVAIGLISPVKDYAVVFEVFQNGERIGGDSIVGKSDQQIVEASISLKLQSGGKE